jgi:hypothetical protein
MAFEVLRREATCALEQLRNVEMLSNLTHYVGVYGESCRAESRCWQWPHSIDFGLGIAGTQVALHAWRLGLSV